MSNWSINQFIHISLSFLFLVVVFLSQQLHYHSLLAIVILLVVSIPFLKESSRLLVWIIIGYIFGEFLFIYGVKFIDFLALSSEWKVILGRCFLILYIFPLFIVIKSFRPNLKLPLNRVNYYEKIKVPFILFGKTEQSLYFFLIVALGINIVSLTPLVIKNASHLTVFLFIAAFIFSFVNSLLEELLWRGILLPSMVDITGKNIAIVINSIGFGLVHLSLGFTLLPCLLFMVGGYFFGALTLRTGSIWPSFFWHFVLNLLMVLSGIIFL
ncbi:CPBP family intramembrane glutamic endopeptidase [Peribacillus tepidiphilus]|uniref:CPBP family intramembrane glutamic endopeptidase n=1 Tax=Peribacillus tepidiphilus TaxID=2652445 RepID=UPI0012928352|nr:type II CAAX endopeptidase family protein [Peribacillus tepidiphilus]